MNKKQAFLNGLRDGLPIGTGYFAVSFSLGIIAKKVGLTPIEGFLTSVFARASAGEYAGYSMILAHATLVETILVCIITNARYMLMTTALSQRFSDSTPLFHRIFVAFQATDEIFGATIARPGSIIPQYTYGLTAVAAPMWGLGTALGIIAGGVMPARAVSALSVALYGMFIAIIVPPSKHDRTVFLSVAAGFLLSYLLSDISPLTIPFISDLSAGTKTIILTMVISSAAAIIHPVPDNEQKTDTSSGAAEA